MPTACGAPVKYMFKKQPIVIGSQNPPVQNQWYTLLNTTEDVRIIYLTIMQFNTDLANKFLRWWVTIDGVQLGGMIDAVHNTDYYAYLTPFTDGLTLSSTQYNSALYSMLEGHSVMVQYRMTSAPGTNQLLEAYIQYETLEVT